MRKVTRVLQPSIALSYPTHKGAPRVTRCLLLAYVGGMSPDFFLAVTCIYPPDNDNESHEI